MNRYSVQSRKYVPVWFNLIANPVKNQPIHSAQSETPLIRTEVLFYLGSFVHASKSCLLLLPLPGTNATR